MQLHLPPAWTSMIVASISLAAAGCPAMLVGDEPDFAIAAPGADGGGFLLEELTADLAVAAETADGQVSRADQHVPAQPFTISLAQLGAYGGRSQGKHMSATSNPGPLTFLSPLEGRYFAIYFLPAAVRIDGATLVLTIGDPSGIGGPTMYGGNLSYDATHHVWHTDTSGAYLRVWLNRHSYKYCHHKEGELTYAGKTGGPPEITCACDADFCLVTGLSKTSPAGVHGGMTAVDPSRYTISGEEVVIRGD